MYKFDVKYSLEDYYEYYKFLLIKQRILRDIIFGLVFVGVAIYFWIDTSESTSGNLIPIFALVMGLTFPLMNYLTIPMLKKQIKQKQEEIHKTHIVITFNDDEVIYENLTDVKSVEESTESSEGEPKETQNVFNLKYLNFMVIRESKSLFMFYLDRQTVIIIPKATITDGKTVEEFKEYISHKVSSKRIKFIK